MERHFSPLRISKVKLPPRQPKLNGYTGISLEKKKLKVLVDIVEKAEVPFT